ncbi:MAG: DUF1934 domain-containing protein [Clostridia bacterium]|nr:DUF1934 domain-containing protein [Clostridia bacterium]
MEAKIKITTIQTDYKGKSIFDRMADELCITESFSTLDESGVIETTLTGNIDLDILDGKYTLSYEETEASGMEGVKTELSFYEKTPCEICLARSGEVSSTMYFNEGKRDICVYNTGIMPFEICVYTRSIDNRLIEDGYLEIIYIIEIKGACAQKTILRMETQKYDRN